MAEGMNKHVRDFLALVLWSKFPSLRQRKSETDRERINRLFRIHNAAEQWRKDHPGETPPWMIGG